MTATDLQRIRAHAAPDVKETHSRQQLIARIAQNRKDVEALTGEIEQLWKAHEREWTSR